jgi:hypothetical protein
VAVSVKKCRICKTEFTPFNSLAVACSPKCALAIVEQKKAKKHKKELADFRKGDKSIAKLRSEAQKEVNAYIRLRDEDMPCICCGAFSEQVDAGHYRSRGSAKHLAFNCYNIHKQNKHCNRYLGGNYSEYRIGLVKRIGLDKVERLENDNTVRRFDKEYLIRIKQIFAKRARHLVKLRENKY